MCFLNISAKFTDVPHNNNQRIIRIVFALYAVIVIKK